MNAVPKTPFTWAPAASARRAVNAADGSAFSTFGISPLRHNFQDHPLMQIPRLAELAQALLPTEQCRFIVPGSDVGSKFDHRPQRHDGRGLDEFFKRIEEPGSWIALYNVQTNPAYAEFLREVTDSARHLIDPQQPGMFGVGGFIFISAPPSVTPFHIDRENNLWLQVRGRKIINVWDHRDREVVAGSDVDEFIVSGGLDNVRLKDGFREKSREFDVGPGDGVYFPATSPHMTRTTTDWVRPGDGVSISIGVVFYTPHTYRQATIHSMNQMLRRRFKFEPRPPSPTGRGDFLRSLVSRFYIWVLKNVRHYKLSKGLSLP